MKNWRRKAAAFKIIEAIPFGESLFNWYRIQRRIWRPFNLNLRWYAIEEMLRLHRKSGVSVEGKDLAEIGSGWHPVLGPLFIGMGARSVRLTDISPHFCARFINESIVYLISKSKEVSELCGVPAATLEERWRKLLPRNDDWREPFEANGLTYHAPLYFDKTGWANESLDLIYSNSCICYIPRGPLQAVFHESARLLRKGGFVTHNVDPVDILSGTMQFLNYSEEEWDRIGNSKLHYQNRIRPATFTKFAEDAGLRIVYEERMPFPKPITIDRTQLHPEFRDLPDSELLVFHFLFSAQKA